MDPMLVLLGMEHCGVCGERFRDEDDPQAYMGSDERGEFVNDQGESVVAHAQCGLDAGFALA